MAKDNYRESEALTKKMMGLKGKGESKTVAWRSRGIKGFLVKSLRSDEFHLCFCMRFWLKSPHSLSFEMRGIQLPLSTRYLNCGVQGSWEGKTYPQLHQTSAVKE